jgi:hypothetical protein
MNMKTFLKDLWQRTICAILKPERKEVIIMMDLQAVRVALMEAKAVDLMATVQSPDVAIAVREAAIQEIVNRSSVLGEAHLN